WPTLSVGTWPTRRAQQRSSLIWPHRAAVITFPGSSNSSRSAGPTARTPPLAPTAALRASQPPRPKGSPPPHASSLCPNGWWQGSRPQQASGPTSPAPSSRALKRSRAGQCCRQCLCTPWRRAARHAVGRGAVHSLLPASTPCQRMRSRQGRTGWRRPCRRRRNRCARQTRTSARACAAALCRSSPASWPSRRFSQTWRCPSPSPPRPFLATSCTSAGW
ncbi:hypothetical protein JKP88DRAFT_314911, partial [Tribonema minus]